MNGQDGIGEDEFEQTLLHGSACYMPWWVEEALNLTQEGPRSTAVQASAFLSREKRTLSF
jgi:hypothetical protein